MGGQPPENQTLKDIVSAQLEQAHRAGQTVQMMADVRDTVEEIKEWTKADAAWKSEIAIWRAKVENALFHPEDGLDCKVRSMHKRTIVRDARTAVIGALAAALFTIFVRVAPDILDRVAPVPKNATIIERRIDSN